MRLCRKPVFSKRIEAEAGGCEALAPTRLCPCVLAAGDGLAQAACYRLPTPLPLRIDPGVLVAATTLVGGVDIDAGVVRDATPARPGACLLFRHRGKENRPEFGAQDLRARLAPRSSLRARRRARRGGTGCD